MLEIRAVAGYRSLADLDEHFARIGAQLARLEEAIVVTDWRFCPLMSSELSDQLGHRIMRNNARVLRSAALASHDSPIGVLQFLRVIRESGHSSRRLFREVAELTNWLREVLTAAELQALHEFVSFEPTLRAAAGRR